MVKLIEEAGIYKNLKCAFVVNRKIANTAIGREVSEALASYSLPVLASTIGQRVVFAEAAAQGLAVFEVEPNGSAAQEIEALKTELMEFLK